MANYQNHLIDPTYFWDAIEEFSFDYDIYVLTGKAINSSGQTVNTYQKQTIRGSLQSQGTQLVQSLNGNTRTVTYNFYCKSLYRIDIGDCIEYKGKYLMCTSVHDYDEHGVRSASLNMIQLTAYRDLEAYIKYLSGEEYV